MSSQTESKLNRLLKQWPKGTVATQPWLHQLGVPRQLARRYVSSGWMERLGRGAFVRPGEAVDWLLARTLSNRSYGARPLRRAIQRHIEDPLSEAFIRGQIRTGLPIAVAVQDGALWYQQDETGGVLSS